MAKRKCEYCDLPLKAKDPNKITHKLCDVLKDFSNGRNLTYANTDDYPMSWVPPEKEDLFPNMPVNSRGYTYTHGLIARILLNRDLNSQDSDDPEIVDHIRGNQSKRNIAPNNLKVMKLKDHVSSHKKEKGSGRKYKDGKSIHKYDKE